MPIFSMCEADHPDAIQVEDTENVFYRKWAEGKVLYERERNGYHDSDFYAYYWCDETESVRSTMFATTRGWCSPCFATCADATDEVKEKAKVWQQYRDRMLRIQQERRTLHNDLKEAKKCKLSLSQYRKLQYCTNDSCELAAYVKLLVTRANNRFRSKFRHSLADQVFNWCTQENNRYPYPLSAKQAQYI